MGEQRPGLSPWECHTAWSHQARPEEAQEPSWGAAKGGTLAVLPLLELRLALKLGVQVGRGGGLLAALHDGRDLDIWVVVELREVPTAGNREDAHFSQTRVFRRSCGRRREGGGQR